MRQRIISVFTIFLLILLFQVVSFSRQGEKVKNIDSAMATKDKNNKLSSKEKTAGWILLFDGQTTKGWRGYNKPAFPDSGWSVENGTLRCIGSPNGRTGGAGGDILYNRKFKDFDLKLEWKISGGGNSGIFYFAQELPNEPVWKSAYEMQILDNLAHADAKLGKNGNRQAGSLYDLVPAVPQNTLPVGEWNQVEIIVSKGTITHFQNGEKILECRLGTPEWEKMIKESKFKDFPEFGKYVEGFISLQDHGNDVWFRNIKVKAM